MQHIGRDAWQRASAEKANYYGRDDDSPKPYDERSMKALRKLLAALYPKKGS